MKANCFLLLPEGPAYATRHKWCFFITFFLIYLFTQTSPAHTQGSMTLNGYDLNYEKGIVNISEDYGPQFIDIVNVVITSQDGERFTADSLLFRATGTLEKLDSIDQAKFVNAKLLTTLNSDSKAELNSGLIKIKNINLRPQDTFDEFAEWQHKNRTQQGYLAISNFDLKMPEEGFEITIENFIADNNPDMINEKLPKGQYVFEAKLENARLLPFAKGEATLIYQLLLSGLNMDAIRLDINASFLNQITPKQIDGELHAEFVLDRLLNFNIGMNTTLKAENYNLVHPNHNLEQIVIKPYFYMSQISDMLKLLTIELTDTGAFQIYDNVSGGLGLPNRTQLALQAFNHIQTLPHYLSELLAKPVVNFIQSGGHLHVSAEPHLLTEDDLKVSESAMLETFINTTKMRLQHTP